MSTPTQLSERGVLLRGSVLARGLLRLAGWRVKFSGLPAAQGVVIVYPHTSNWDFVVGLLAKWAIGFPVSFWGKDSLFKLPLFGAWLRWLGGIAVNRSAPQGAVGQMVKTMIQAREQGQFLWLALAPEGTRSRTAGWRMGFYRVALGADVPLGLVRLDYGRKQVHVDSFWRLSGQVPDDFAALAQHFDGVQACRPEQAAPVQPIEVRPDAPLERAAEVAHS